MARRIATPAGKIGSVAAFSPAAGGLVQAFDSEVVDSQFPASDTLLGDEKPA